jgi:hypothetical protein
MLAKYTSIDLRIMGRGSRPIILVERSARPARMGIAPARPPVSFAPARALAFMVVSGGSSSAAALILASASWPLRASGKPRATSGPSERC